MASRLPAISEVERSQYRIDGLIHHSVIPAKAGIPQILASRLNDNDTSASSAHSQFSIFNFQFPSPRLLLTLLILPFIFGLDLFYFTLARPGCAACANFSGFLADSSLTVALIPANSEVANWIKIFKSRVIV